MMDVKRKKNQTGVVTVIRVAPRLKPLVSFLDYTTCARTALDL